MPSSAPATLREQIAAALAAFGSRPLFDASVGLLDVLGYRSQRRLRLRSATAEGFLGTFDRAKTLNPERTLLVDWRGVEFLLQLTDSEVRAAALADVSTPEFAFASAGTWDRAIVESYLFLAIDLVAPGGRSGDRNGKLYTRTELAGIVRAVNRLFDMPVMLFFKHGNALTLGVADRRLSKRDASRDVLDKVTLVKDIDFADPLRAHVEILYDLALSVLHEEYRFHNFVGLHQAWQRRFASYELNERFYREIANWYFWTLGRIKSGEIMLPRDVDSDEHRSLFLIRLLTRIIFCWFLQEKKLIPRDLFRRRMASELLADFSPEAGTYYRAILQNLFFATLSVPIEERRFLGRSYHGRNKDYGRQHVFRYKRHLKDGALDRFTALMEPIPFLNGGLFECLDRVPTETDRATEEVRIDGFSDPDSTSTRVLNGRQAELPNELFFDFPPYDRKPRVVDLSSVYDDTRFRHVEVRGLVDILTRYKFTIEENTPLDQEIALDPELLGKVFENLLASYNEDTKTSARKATGSFYTRREIVSYLVDNALSRHLAQALAETNADARLARLFASDAAHYTLEFDDNERAQLIATIFHLKIIDPACGSGAFPMGCLQRLVDLLTKLDPDNTRWRSMKLSEIDDPHLRAVTGKVFDDELANYTRKLYLIENCLYGVDIQAIAIQIAKLRCFIALIVDQQVKADAPNRGVLALPNLETRFVVANTLVPFRWPKGFEVAARNDDRISRLEQEIRSIRHRYFTAQLPADKIALRDEDRKKREEFADLLRRYGRYGKKAADDLIEWEPYRGETPAKFFDPGWMFGLRPTPRYVSDEGTLAGELSLVNEAAGQTELSASAGQSPVKYGSFGIVIGNPPYVRIQTLKQQDPALVEFYREHYDSAGKGNYDLYVVFVEAGLRFLKRDGQLAYILPHKFFNAQYGEPLRKLIAAGRHLRHVVHFGDQQVFPGATNYVCLLFLARAGADTCRFVRSDDLTEWLRTFKGSEGSFPAAGIGAPDWTFAVGKGATIFEKIQALPDKLGEVADVFVGLQTSADDVFILQYVRGSGDRLRLKSKSLQRDVELERSLLRPIVSGTDVGSYEPMPERQFLLFPYSVVTEKAALLSFKQIAQSFPLTAKYLSQNRERLEQREGGKFSDEAWYRFGRSQNLGIQDRAKICVPRLVEVLHASSDLAGHYYLDNVDVGGVTWKSQYSSRPLQILQALLNSAVLRWFFPQISAPFRGGFLSANRQYVSLLPVVSTAPAQETTVVRLVDYLLWLNRHFVDHPEAKTARDSVMLGWWEQVLNGFVYELYFPDELYARGLRLFDQAAAAALPALGDLPTPRRLDLVRQHFERTYHIDHPLRAAIFALGDLETVRIIEGRTS